MKMPNDRFGETAHLSDPPQVALARHELRGRLGGISVNLKVCPVKRRPVWRPEGVKKNPIGFFDVQYKVGFLY